MKDLKIFTDNIESEAITQIYELLNQEAFKDAKVRIMPDVHAGKGCVIGFTADLGNKVIPNIVGVDIGCGMLICKLPSIFKEIRILLIYPFTRRLNSSMLRISGRPLSSSVFRRWKKLSIGALSRQLAFCDILWIK